MRISNGWIAQLLIGFGRKCKKKGAANFLQLRHADAVEADSATTINNGRHGDSLLEALKEVFERVKLSQSGEA